ncbi:hypothetical protein CS0771_07720 [Catellatospora sp. IY07-71]|uniref:hypothetical protein n=1 Tax=Catellatospora sp. IY07-71 TaxID=2728827 RepID=UPI001BB3FB93|nr:hypothetical protein [Catellatospora sp. IY07-71]BCJ71228.1 hypothetical protein CS0771_07720 [Catellatospora sp. IY07-71]
MTSVSQARWIISSGEEVYVGDHVALAQHPDAVGLIVGLDTGHTGWPEVRVTEGPKRGQVLNVLPSDILVKVRR